MNVELSPEDLDTLITSLEYSQRAVRDARDTPPDVRQQNLERLDAVAEKLRSARHGRRT
jgi:hypothetical protein